MSLSQTNLGERPYIHLLVGALSAGYAHTSGKSGSNLSLWWPGQRFFFRGGGVCGRANTQTAQICFSFSNLPRLVLDQTQTDRSAKHQADFCKPVFKMEDGPHSKFEGTAP